MSGYGGWRSGDDDAWICWIADVWINSLTTITQSWTLLIDKSVLLVFSSWQGIQCMNRWRSGFSFIIINGG